MKTKIPSAAGARSLVLVGGLCLAACQTAPKISTSSPDAEPPTESLQALAEGAGALEKTPATDAESRSEELRRLEELAGFTSHENPELLRREMEGIGVELGSGARPAAPGGESSRSEARTRSQPVDVAAQEPPTATPEANGRDAAPPASPAVAEPVARSPEDVLRASDDTVILGELERRNYQALQVANDQTHTQRSTDPDEQANLASEYRALQESAARRVLAVGFLRDTTDAGGPADRTPTAHSVAETVLDDPSSDETSRLLLAAYYASSGQVQEVDRLLATLRPEDSVQPQTSTQPFESGALIATVEDLEPEVRHAKPAERGFSVVRAVFARGIEGPGAYCTLPQDEIQPGKLVLVYGEFRNFRTEKLPAKSTGHPHVCAFAAGFRLVDAQGETIDEVDFLPPHRGRQQLENDDDTVNFWARYRIPATLEPGAYDLFIDAEDLFGKVDTSASIPFKVE